MMLTTLRVIAELWKSNPFLSLVLPATIANSKGALVDDFGMEYDEADKIVEEAIR